MTLDAVMTPKLIQFTLLLAMLLVLSAFSQRFGQLQNRSISGSNTRTNSDVISCTTYLLTIEVRLAQQDGAFELGKESFTLYDNEVQQDFNFWTRIESSDTENKEAIYAIGIHPVLDGKLHKIKIAVRNKANKKLRVQFSPARYRATKEFIGEVRNDDRTRMLWSSLEGILF